MEDYLRRTKSLLGAGGSEGPRVHAVLGGPDSDVDTVASTLCLALHLSQKVPLGAVCVPVLWAQRCDVVLPGATLTYLRKMRVCEEVLLWKDDVDLLKLQHDGKLSLTLLTDQLLDSSEYHTLESSVLRVIYRRVQRDAGDEEQTLSTATTVVTREILQEAAERVRAPLGEMLGEALRLQSESLWLKHGHRSAQVDELMRSLEERSDVTRPQYHDQAQLTGPALEQLLLQQLKEFSDGEMTIAFTSLTTLDLEDLPGAVGELKTFCHRHGYEGLVVVLSVYAAAHPPHLQLALYSDNTDILHQICCELEESSSVCLSELEAGDCSQASLELYHLPLDSSCFSGAPSLVEEEIQDLLKEFVERRRSVLACHPSSRTSSTEGVAGSVEFSQGSSGINDMYGSDAERPEAGGGGVVVMARVLAESEEEAGGVVGGVGGELVSPDSGMATIRSSKESSVFLSDDSPIADVTAGMAAAAGGLLRGPSPLGFPSLSPPIPPEMRKRPSNRNRNDHFDLFSFDPLHSSNTSPPSGGAVAHSRGGGGSSSLSEFEELSLVDFSAPDSSIGLGGGTSMSHCHRGDIHVNEVIDIAVPPTPVNSLVGSCPPSGSEVRFFPEDIAERISGLQHKDSVSSSLSEAWDEIGLDTCTGSTSDDTTAWSLSEAGGSDSIENVLEGMRDKGKSLGGDREGDKEEEVVKSKSDHQRDLTLKPQLSLIMEHTESYDNWNPDSGFTEPWNSVTLAELQLTPPEEEEVGKRRAGFHGDKTSSAPRKRELLSTLTPESSKEEEDGGRGRQGERQTELQDFWSYSAQKGFLKSDSGTTTPYPESLDMWNMTIRDDSRSPLTTPDIADLSERSDSFCGRVPALRSGASLESPLGMADGGMQMWNTTIQEDSASTATSPEGPETESNDLDRMESWDTSAKAPGTHVRKQEEEEEEEGEEKEVKEERYAEKGLGEQIKIVIEGEEGRTWTEEEGDGDTTFLNQDMMSETLQDSSNQEPEAWAMPVPNMVTSTSEYDNIGAGALSSPSSPETHTSPGAELIQTEGQFSPFISVVKPMEIDGDQHQRPDSHRNTDSRLADTEQTKRQVFLFEGTSQFGNVTRSGWSCTENEYDNKRGEGSEEVSEGPDWTEQLSGQSPFVVVDGSSPNRPPSTSHHLDPAVIQTQTHQSPSTNVSDWDSPPTPVKKDHGSELTSTSASLEWTTKIIYPDDPPIVGNRDPSIESNGNLEAAITDAMSLSSGSGGERDGLKPSPDSLLPGSRDDIRSNSDGDSSSGLEMDYIIVSGIVKESERERREVPRPREEERGKRAGGEGGGRLMETYSMLSYAATILQNQAQASHRQHQENTEQQNRQNQTITDTDSPHSSDTKENQALSYQNTNQCNIDTSDKHTTHQKHSETTVSHLSCPNQSNTDTGSSSQSITDGRQHQLIADKTSPDGDQSKTDTQILPQTDSRSSGSSQSQLQEGNHDDQSGVVVRSVSASLRYPSDHFLKTREEVYVHSQISLEDSDEGGHSPSAPPPPLPDLGGLQGWGGQVEEQHLPPRTPERQSPVLTDSSVSHNSSLIGTPVSESGHSMERGVGLPFSGDLMEEEEEEEEEETDLEPSDHSDWSSRVEREGEGLSHTQRPHSGKHLSPAEVLAGSEELIGCCSSQQYDGQASEPMRDELHSAGSQSSYLGLQDLTSQPWTQLTNENAQYQWTGSQEPTDRRADDQIQYGYHNHHHTDQRSDGYNHTTEQHGYYETTSQQQNTDTFYTEFGSEPTTSRYGSEPTTSRYGSEPTTSQYGSEPAGGYYETGTHSEDPEQYKTDGQYNAEDLSCSESQGQVHNPTTEQYHGLHQCHTVDYAHYQYDGQTFDQSEAHRENEDHAQYVPKGYAHFLLSRPSQQGEDDVARTMMAMMKMESSEEEAGSRDNRADPPSSLDLSGGSNQRKKLVAPPLSVSLDRSEGSLLSDDALDMGDEALDTGDDLDINVDDIDTPDEADSLEYNTHGDSELSNQGAGAVEGDAIPEYSAAEERRDSRLWRSVVIGEQEHRIDMRSIEIYQRVLSHGGYYGDQNAIIVFAACFLPDSDCDNYHYVMENLFLYVISTLELMVAEDYMIVYLNGATPRRRMPGFSWMKRCYQMIDRRLKKNLKSFIIVHPSWFIRTVLGITRPFISSKFNSKIKYVNTLAELRGMIPMEYIHIPPSIVKYEQDRGIHSSTCLRLDEELQDPAAKADKRGGNSAV